MAATGHLLTTTRRWAYVLWHITFSTATPFSTHKSMKTTISVLLYSAYQPLRCSALLHSALDILYTYTTLSHFQEASFQPMDNAKSLSTQ